MLPVAVAYDPVCLEHDPNARGGAHPERVERLHAVMRVLSEAVTAGRAQLLPSADCPPDLVAEVHAPAYLAEVEGACRDGHALDADTRVCAETPRVARRAAGLGVAAVEAVLDGRAASAFVAPRPPGHHARADRSSGFCVLNNVAIAAAAARRRGVGRIAIIDFDVHHGDGTQSFFEGDPDTLFVSSHQLPGWPGSGRAAELGRGAGYGTTLNCPVPPGTGDGALEAFYGAVVRRVVDGFAPELVLVSAGFDLLRGDPLGELDVSSDGLRAILAHVVAAAQGSASGRLVAFLEGGYDLSNLAEGTSLTLEALAAPATLAEAPLERLGAADHLRTWRAAFRL